MPKKFNAIKHGILSRKITILSGESRYGFRKLKQTVLDEYRPETDVESALVDYLTICFWRLNRALRLESKVVSEIEHEWEQYSEPDRQGLSPLNFVKFEKLDQILRYTSSIQRAIFRTKQELERIKTQKLNKYEQKDKQN